MIVKGSSGSQPQLHIRITQSDILNSRVILIYLLWGEAWTSILCLKCWGDLNKARVENQGGGHGERTLGTESGQGKLRFWIQASLPSSLPTEPFRDLLLYSDPVMTAPVETFHGCRGGAFPCTSQMSHQPQKEHLRPTMSMWSSTSGCAQFP